MSSSSEKSTKSPDEKMGIDTPSTDVPQGNVSKEDITETANASPILATIAKLPAGIIGGTESNVDDISANDLPPSDDLSFDRALIPMSQRLIAFSMIVFFSTGSSYCENTLSPLKSTLKTELGINNAQYGAIASASSLVNTILPIIGGIGMDHWGASRAALVSSIFVFVGATIAAASSNTGNFGLLIGGRILMGFGSTVIEATQSKLYAHWFTGSWLAVIYGVDIAWSRITTVIARSTAVPMSEIGGFWGWALWIPTITTAVNLALVCLYMWFESRIPQQYKPATGANSSYKTSWKQRQYGLQAIFKLPIFFLLVCLTQIPQNAVISTYTANLADIQTQTRGTSTLASGYNASLQGIIPIVVTPIIGYVFDKYGWRMLFVSSDALLYITVFALIGLTKVHPLIPILISSFALSTNAIAFIAAIPVLVGDDSLLGTAFGFWKAFANCNTIILEIVAGAIQDDSPTQSYNAVIYLLIGIKILQVGWGPFYHWLDGRWLGHSLRKPEVERVALRRQVKMSGTELRGWQVSKKFTYFTLAILTSLIITSWVLYILYSLGD